jgi:tetratricopeptide (TPR) repeat protein
VSLGPYEIVAQLGAGGMGEVYRARDTRLGRDVAIKVLPADFAADTERLRRFEREARATAALSHPNVIDIHDVGVHDGVPYLVEELLHGESLRVRLVDGPLDVSEAVRIGVQIAQGLAAAHERRIVHRDLKPENVFITESGIVKILDFGLAKSVEPASDPAAETITHQPTGASEPGRAMGTVAYMAPEQARGLPCDQRADIFAFGCVLYEMLSGERPFRGQTATDTVAAILKEEPPPLPESVRPALQRIVTQCLAKRPDQRFFSAHDVALALHSASSPAEGASVIRGGSGLPVSARQRRVLLVAGVLCIAAIVGALWIWQPWHVASKPAGLVAERVASVLALPCKVYGAQEVAFLTDAVPGTISTLLAQVEGLDTKVPPSSFEVEKVKGDLARLAEIYGVSSLVVTSIYTSAGALTLNVQLVDAATRKVRWGRQYEGSRETYNELARQAAEGIRQAVRPAAPPVLAPGVSSESELAFREGAYYFNRYVNFNRPGDFEGTAAAFTRALALDPSFAAAAGRMAALFAVRVGREEGTLNSRKEAESWARRALGIDPHCGEAWAALSHVEMYSTHSDPERGTGYAVKAAAFAAREAWVHKNLGAWMNTFPLGVAAELRSLALDPFLLDSAALAAFGLCLQGRPGEALAIVDRGLKVEPNWPKGPLMRGLALSRLGRLEEAEQELRRFEAAYGAAQAYSKVRLVFKFSLAVAQRDEQTSDALAQRILALVLDSRAESGNVVDLAYASAPALAHVGRPDDAIRILQRCDEVGAQINFDWLLADPDIQLLRSDPRFAKILAASRKGALMDLRILGQARDRGELPSYLNQPLDELIKLLRENGGTS